MSNTVEIYIVFTRLLNNLHVYGFGNKYVNHWCYVTVLTNSLLMVILSSLSLLKYGFVDIK